MKERKKGSKKERKEEKCEQQYKSMWLTIHDPANTALLILLALRSKALEVK